VNEALVLGHEEIDEAHRQFWQLLQRCIEADKAHFAELFSELNHHLEQHFAEEEALMAACNFAASTEHRGEHRRILGAMNQFQKQVARNRTQMARAYVQEALPEWFGLHITTMDGALVQAAEKLAS